MNRYALTFTRKDGEDYLCDVHGDLSDVWPMLTEFSRELLKRPGHDSIRTYGGTAQNLGTVTEIRVTVRNGWAIYTVDGFDLVFDTVLCTFKDGEAIGHEPTGELVPPWMTTGEEI